MPLFAAGSFVDPPASLEALCQITDPRKGARTVRTEVIRGSAHRGVSDGMREWAILGWYGMPAFAILYTLCCPSAPELHIPFPNPTCDLEGAMKALATVATSPTSSDDDVAAALKTYTKAAKCTAQTGFADSFDQQGDIQEGELATFQKTLDRARAHRAPH